jgi:TRAP-type uncharacterized transport system substrate-binding protein
MSAPMSAPQSAQKAMRWLERKVIYSVGFGIMLMLATGVGLFLYQRAEIAESKVLRIGFGSGGPVRRAFLEQLAQRAKSQNLDVQLVVTEGTAETITLIEQGKTELGLITGAIEGPRSDTLLEIMPLYMESLQLLVKEPLFEAVSKDFGQLRGRTIALDGQQSATNLVASELLRFIGLIDGAGTRHYTAVHLQQPELVALRDHAALPDAIFQIGGLPSQTIRHFVVNHNYRLVALPFGSSFNLEKFRLDASAAVPGAADLAVDRAFVEEFVIPAYSYSVLPPVPAEDARTIASRLLLVGSANVEAATIRKLLDVILSPEISELVRPSLNVELLSSPFQFTRHPGTTEYVESLQPIDVDSAFTNYGRIVEVWGLIIAGYVFVAGALKKWQQRRQNALQKSVSDFMREVMVVEEEATGTRTHEERAALDQRLTDIKRSAIDMHLKERLEDAESLPSLLVTLADTRTRIWGSRA